MIEIVFDSNIYDLLEADSDTVKQVQTVIGDGQISVLMPRQVAEELRARSTGIPELFPTVPIGHAVARAGVMRAGDFLGDGTVFDTHKGNSAKDADAFIVDVAAMAADWFVSEDTRSLHRFPKSAGCIPMRYDVFREKIRALLD